MADVIENAWTVVADYACLCGENPLWHTDERKLYWCDIPSGRLFWLDPATGEHHCCYKGRQVGGFTFQADGKLLLFRDKGNVVVWQDGEELETIVEALPGEGETRWNDIMADPEGRIFGGTMPTSSRQGRMYRMDLNGGCTILEEGIGCSNGMGFTPDGKQMYYTDTPTTHIYRYDYDRASGELSNKQVAVTVDQANGGPDGMICLADGDILSAHWGGSGVYRYDAAGQLKVKYTLPTPCITSLIATGNDLTDFYVTSAGGGDKEKNGEHAGALFKLNIDGQGQPECRSRIGLS